MAPERTISGGPIERCTRRSGVRVRYLDNAPGEAVGLPILFSPGLTDFADEYDTTLEFFLPRRVLVVEVRGRGRSETPPTGYAAGDHARDLAAVVAEEGLSRFHLMTFSRGTSWALDLALAEPSAIASLSIGDYLAAEIGLSPEWVEGIWGSTFRGRPMPQRVERHVLEELQLASHGRELWEQLGSLEAPLLVARGSQGGLIDDTVVERYRSAVPDVEVVTIPGAGHDLFRPNRTAYPAAVHDFVARHAPDC
jgi:pimeloyl-ACP methyl ester carboxylesterase